MEKLLLFSLSFILCTLLAAQEILPAIESGNRSTNENDGYILVQDYDMVWDYSESVWEHTRNVTYDYNEFHNPIEKFESWTDGRGPYAKTNCFYDANQNLDEEREYRYNDSEWVNNVKNLYNYDGNSNRTQKIRQSWDGEQFENEIKNTYAYDVNNNKIWSMMYYWEDDDWSESQEFDYQYDENGYLYKIESEAWVDDEWRKFQKSIYAYDTSNLLLSIESSLWDPETSSWFHPHHKQLYTYDQDNNRIIFIIQSWNEYDEFWYNLYKTTYYYQLADYETNVNKRSNINKVIEDLQTTEDDIIIDPGRDDIMLVGIEVMLDSITHTSVGDLEITLLHNGISETIVYHAGGDGDNFITTKLSDQGVDSLANGIAPFYGIYKPENPLSAFLDTDPAGTWTLSIYDGVDGNTGTLQSWGINLIYASAASAVDDNYYNESDLVLYPNPAFNKINLESPIFDQQSSVIEIFDLNGRKLIEKQIKSGSESIEIDVSGLATGVYFCQVKLNDKRITKKLIKK
jgi:subtilisin-like proprotein convertase family protein